jgi:hypothetical protein
MSRQPANPFRVMGYVLAISAVLLAVLAAFIWTQTGAVLLVAATILMLAGCGALWLAQTRGGAR